MSQSRVHVHSLSHSDTRHDTRLSVLLTHTQSYVNLQYRQLKFKEHFPTGLDDRGLELCAAFSVDAWLITFPPLR